MNFLLKLIAVLLFLVSLVLAWRARSEFPEYPILTIQLIIGFLGIVLTLILSQGFSQNPPRESTSKRSFLNHLTETVHPHINWILVLIGICLIITNFISLKPMIDETRSRPKPTRIIEIQPTQTLPNPVVMVTQQPQNETDQTDEAPITPTAADQVADSPIQSILEPQSDGCNTSHNWIEYTLQLGDTVSYLVDATGTNEDQFMAINCTLDSANIIFAGQRVWLPQAPPVRAINVQPTSVQPTAAPPTPIPTPPTSGPTIPIQPTDVLPTPVPPTPVPPTPISPTPVPPTAVPTTISHSIQLLNVEFIESVAPVNGEDGGYRFDVLGSFRNIPQDSKIIVLVRSPGTNVWYPQDQLALVMTSSGTWIQDAAWVGHGSSAVPGAQFAIIAMIVPEGIDLPKSTSELSSIPYLAKSDPIVHTIP